MNKKLYLFVENFSDAKREEFFEKELPFLCEEFEKVVLLPLYSGNHSLVYHNPKIEVVQFNAFSGCNRTMIVVSHFFLISKIFIYELVKTHNRKFYLKNFSSLLNTLILRIAAAKRLKELVKKDSAKIVFYTYWFNQWTFILSLLKTWEPTINLLSRVHGSDYKEEQTNTTLAFRYFQLQQVNKIVPVSEYAKNYLIKKFDVHGSKLVVSRLGLANSSKLSPINKQHLILVSCSSLIALKRVHLIPEILMHLSCPATWIHFGSGSEQTRIAEKIACLPAHIKVEMKGYVENVWFINYLENNPVSFFVNVSENEGIPVTLMEAANCGIPLIGTNVCGIPEIVTTETGTLIPVDFAPQDVATFIEKAHQKKDIYTLENRRRIQTFCHQHFSAKTNYTKLAKYLSV